MTRFPVFLLLFVMTRVSPAAAPTTAPTSAPAVGSKAHGYHGIWYANQATHDEYKYKYSGGLGTYCAKHIPLAWYAEAVQKTFFVYGGMPVDGQLDPKKRELLIMVSYYDHRTGRVPRPTLLMHKHTSDAHDNPVLSLDSRGYVWVFVAAHGTARPAYIYRSTEPYRVDAFELVLETNFSYPQPWYIEGKGFLFLHTRYQNERRVLYCMTSPDGVAWSEPTRLAEIARGHYQVSWRFGDKVGTAFNYHPDKGGLNARTNLYYMETADFGQTWRTAQKKKLELPLTTVDNPARVRDYEAQGWLVYLKDLNFDKFGNPVVQHLVSRGWQPGPANDPRIWSTARWVGREWEITGILRSDNNYDTGCLHVEEDLSWRLFAPTDPGPQPFNPGGEMVLWTTDDQGRSWHRTTMTHDSRFNHNYARRPVNAHPEFYAFWADGHGRQPSESRLYFADRDGNVFRLPFKMTEDFAVPEKVE